MCEHADVPGKKIRGRRQLAEQQFTLYCECTCDKCGPRGDGLRKRNAALFKRQINVPAVQITFADVR